MIQELDKVVHQWCDDNDRWMYIEYDCNGMVMGLNFMQGDEYECFKKSWCVSDIGMTAFYKQMLYTFPIECNQTSTLVFINKCMWAYHSAISEYEDNNCKIGNATKCYANKCCKAISGR
jgi:hypothetical protein